MSKTYERLILGMPLDECDNLSSIYLYCTAQHDCRPMRIADNYQCLDLRLRTVYCLSSDQTLFPLAAFVDLCGSTIIARVCESGRVSGLWRRIGMRTARLANDDWRERNTDTRYMDVGMRKHGWGLAE